MKKNVRFFDSSDPYSCFSSQIQDNLRTAVAPTVNFAPTMTRQSDFLSLFYASEAVLDGAHSVAGSSISFATCPSYAERIWG
jgi:hypothetical protein